MSAPRLFPEYVLSTAEFDGPARIYRYVLRRVWREAAAVRVALFNMLNPSTADELVLDNTLRRCECFARAWGYDGMTVTNAFALRSTDPSALRRHANPVGPGNDAAIYREARAADIVVCGWGSHGTLRDRHLAVREIIALAGKRAMCFGITRNGQPRHPLYLSCGATLMEMP